MKKKSQNSGNKYAHLAAPERQLDFHQLGRLTPSQIGKEIEFFLVKAQQEKLAKVLIITGKGLHSKDGQAIIKPFILAYLKKSDLVKNYSFAPVDQGGDGAIMVALNFF